MSGDKNSCTCYKCRGACQSVPGWFRPEQIEPLAVKMGLTPKQLFDQYLRVDFWECADWGTRKGEHIVDTIFVLGPQVKHHKPGEIAEPNPSGTCRFFMDGKCSIHELGKPQECHFFVHGVTHEEVHSNHRETAIAWDTPEYQALIETLFGGKPCAPEYDPIGLLGAF